MTRKPTASLSRRLRPRHHEAARVDLWLESVEHAPDDERVTWLDGAELSRADRFRFECDRTRFVNRRAFLREVLSRYLAIPPARVRLWTDGRGRPQLDAGSDLVFSTSHSDGLAVVAVTHARAVGVDIERLRPIDDALDLARGLFHEREVQALQAVADEKRAAAFLKLWTRKESVAKATGHGLSMRLDGFDVLAEDGGVGRPRGAHGVMPYVYSDLGRPDTYAGSVALGDATTRPIVSVMAAP